MAKLDALNVRLIDIMLLGEIMMTHNPNSNAVIMKLITK